MCEITHLYAWHDSSTCATWLKALTCAPLQSPLDYGCATWLIYTWDMTRLHVRHVSKHTYVPRCNLLYTMDVWHDSFACATRLTARNYIPLHSPLVYKCVTTHPQMRHDSFYIHVRHDSDLHVRNDSFICAIWLIYTCNTTHGTQMSPFAITLQHTATL